MTKRFSPLSTLLVAFHLSLLPSMPPAQARAEPAGLRLAIFREDVTVPLGHRLMGILPERATRVSDPLEARGFVLVGSGLPIVWVAVDWCEIRNEAYDRWREALATAADTEANRVLVTSLHQHDAPVADLGAQRLLDRVGLKNALCDAAFHELAIERVANAVRKSLQSAQPVTHVGAGQAVVRDVASNRRVVLDGRPTFSRGSRSGSDGRMANAPEGLIDPVLRTISFWNGDTPLLALHAYATHPMSYYGGGEVSADFVGLARRMRQKDDPNVFQIYVSGCSGDVTAGKFNDGAPENRPRLAARLHDAMCDAWRNTQRWPLDMVGFRAAELSLPFRNEPNYSASELEATIANAALDERDRILAAMALASRQRVEAGRKIAVPCLDFGKALLVLLPGESFVGYQLMAQRLRPDVMVVCAGYGECWPGYIPTRSAFDEGFTDKWLWVAPGADANMKQALAESLREPALPTSRPPAPDSQPNLAVDVFPATDEHPRYSEGSILPLNDGSLLFANTEFDKSTSDFAAGRIVARRSADGGKTWSPPEVLQDNVGRMNVMSVTLRRFRSPGNSGVGLFYLVKHDVNELKVYLRISGDDGRSFGPPILVTDASGYHVLNNDRVTQLLDGRLLCPIAWSPDVEKDGHFVSFCYWSDDGGQSWHTGASRVDVPQRGAMEPEVLELNDGSVLMIIRTQLGEIYASRSSDRGETWSQAEPWGVKSPESPATLRRIPSTGDLLLVWNPDYQQGTNHGGGRTPLVAAVSKDEGRTWGPHRVLEDRADQQYAYTSLAFHHGQVLLSYYVYDSATGQISTRFRSLPIGWFYENSLAK